MGVARERGTEVSVQKGRRLEAVVQRCSAKNVFCKKRPQACNFIKKETLAQVFSCEFCEISKNTFLQKTPLVAASGRSLLVLDPC